MPQSSPLKLVSSSAPHDVIVAMMELPVCFCMRATVLVHFFSINILLVEPSLSLVAGGVARVGLPDPTPPTSDTLQGSLIDQPIIFKLLIAEPQAVS
jgi:hypothetical protein